MYGGLGMFVPSLHRESTDSDSNCVHEFNHMYNLCIYMYMYVLYLHSTSRRRQIKSREGFQRNLVVTTLPCLEPLR